MASNAAATANELVKDTATRRTIRTGIQFGVALVLSGAFDLLIQRLTNGSPEELRPVVLGLWMLVVVQAQNWAENNGYIPPVLRTKANVKDNVV